MSDDSGAGARNQEALKFGLRFLRTRPRFSDEVRRHVMGQGFSPEEAAYVVEHLQARRILDDAKTAELVAERNSGKRARGSEFIAKVLEDRGASPETIEERLAQLGSEPDRALQALQTKYREAPTRAQAGRFLFGRGFSEEAIEAALDAFSAAH